MKALAILVVDDDHQIRRLIRTKLEAVGHSVIDAENGAIGLDAMAEVVFDVVITDILMPIRDGLEFIVDVRSRAHRTAIIAISGGGVRGPGTYLDSALGFGADIILCKPFSLSELNAAINLVATD